MSAEPAAATRVAVGRLEAICLTTTAAGPMVAVDTARAVAGKGLEGDRYFQGIGTYSQRPGGGRQLTLIEAEALEGLARDTGIQLGPAESRRNLVTRGIALNDLVGKRFRVGTVECVGVRLCPPCAHLERLSRPGVNKGLVDRGGLRADILTDGQLTVGDAIQVVGENA